MYGYEYEYGQNSGQEGVPSLIKYSIWAPKTNIDGTRSIINEASSGITNDLALSGGSALNFFPDKKVTIPINDTLGTLITYIDGVQTITDNYGAVTDFIIENSGIHKDYYGFTRNLTQQEKDLLVTQPEQFYIWALAEPSCVLNGPCSDKDSYFRNMAKYLEVLVASAPDMEEENGSTITENLGVYTVTTSGVSNTAFRINKIFSRNKHYTLKVETLESSEYFDFRWNGVFDSGEQEVTDANGNIYKVLFDIGTESTFVRVAFGGANETINIKRLDIYEAEEGIYPIENYTPDMNKVGVTYGVDNGKREIDTLGKPIGIISPYVIGYGDIIGTIPQHAETVDVNLTVNPTSLSGNVLSGGLTLLASGLTLNQDNEVELLNQTVGSDIIVGDGFKGTIKLYKETEL